MRDIFTKTGKKRQRKKITQFVDACFKYLYMKSILHFTYWMKSCRHLKKSNDDRRDCIA